MPQSSSSASTSQCQKVIQPAKTLNFFPEGYLCLLLGPQGSQEDFGILVNNLCLQDIFEEMPFILLALGTIWCYCSHPLLPDINRLRQFILSNRLPTHCRLFASCLASLQQPTHVLLVFQEPSSNKINCCLVDFCHQAKSIGFRTN